MGICGGLEVFHLNRVFTYMFSWPYIYTVPSSRPCDPTFPFDVEWYKHLNIRYGVRVCDSDICCYGRGGNSLFSTFTASNITTISSALAVAGSIRVAFPTAYAASLAEKIGASPTPRVQTVPDLPRETGVPPASHELSTAAKAGIGVGSVLGAIIITLAIMLLWMRSRRKRAIPTQESTQVPEMEDQDGNLAKRKWFLGCRWRSEADAERTAQELDSKTVHVVPRPPAELEAQDYSQDTSHSQ
jgi:hypothetical protein